MERNSPPVEQIPSLSFERGEEPPRLSRIQRAVRSLLTPILFGSAVAATTLPLPAEGDDPPKEERKAEDPILLRLRQEIPALIADLDSKSFRVREQAQTRLRQVVTEWVKTKQQLFPLLPLLRPTKEHSIEQSHRLKSVLDVHEHEELQLLWRPTRFQEPLQWKGRKDAPRVREVLEALEKQTGGRISLRGGQDFAQRGLQRRLEGKTVWEVLERVRELAGGKVNIFRASDGTLVITPYSPGVAYAADSSVLGAAYARYEDYPLAPERHISVSFLTENALTLGDASIRKATGVTDKGRTVTFMEEPTTDAFGKAVPRMPCVYPTLAMSYEEGEQTVDCTVTATLRGYETRVEKVSDLTKVTRCPVGPYVLYIGGRSQASDAFPRYGSIEARLHGGKESSEAEQWLLRNAMQCRAFDAKGGPIGSHGYTSWGASQWTWHFHGDPHSIELVLPVRATTSERTVTFKGIPLNQ